MKTGAKESKIYLKVSVSIIFCVVIAILITSSILYVNFQSILMKHEYEINLEKMESEEEQRLQLANIALNTLYQIYNDISVTKLLTYEKISAVEESAAFLQLRHFLVTMPNVDSIYVYNVKNERIYNVTNENELIRPWNADYYTKSNFYDTSAAAMIEHCTEFTPFIVVPRYYQVNAKTTKCVYTYIMYDIFKNNKKRSAIMLNLESEYLFPKSRTGYPGTESLVVDGTGSVIYSNSSNFKVLDNVKEKFDYGKILNKKKAGYFLDEINGIKSVVIFTDTDKYGFRNVSLINYNDLLAQVKKLQSVTIGITLLIAGAGLIAAFICSYRLSNPIRVMSKDFTALLREKRRTETLTKNIKLKELLENNGFENSGERKSGADLLSLLGIPFKREQKLVLLCIKVDDYQYLLETSNSQLISAYKFAAVNILTELMQDNCIMYCLNMSLDKNLIFVSLTSNEAKEILNEHLIQMQHLVQEYFKISVSAALSDFEEDPDKLFYQYEQIEEALSGSIFWKESSIVHYSDIKMKEVQNYEYPESREKQLLECLTHGRAKEAEEVYLAIVTETYDYPVVIYNMVISRLIFMITNVVNLIMKNSSLHSLTSSLLLTNLLQECDSLEERNEKFKELFLQIAKDMENKKKDRLNQVIADINLLIEKEYKNPLLSIEMLAEEVGMSAAYICRIYKQYTGNTINETLLEKRMEHARVLLVESALSVNEISEKVGFTGSSYFYRVFKKVNGVTPNEYRRK
ncbi:AraC family transcriptional regulator [Anaerocolumna sp. AGMB13025]|uniref:helix-turn-helix domain-containing protein n=1 Tax=Anaerocolumna sp. AGMB13025 TaxID=3039116 RepID=UPI00241FA26A|nr:helix-turn-helix domain-containing protein [Anaerocolumna sp. AGMB13025]WFR55747.1 AraC family transcriptional regulator [Anaerocolumna sp. AGMB13025]